MTFFWWLYCWPLVFQYSQFRQRVEIWNIGIYHLGKSETVVDLVMFSSFSSSNQFDGKAKLKRSLFSKRKTHSSTSDGGIDFKKIKVKFTVLLLIVWILFYINHNTKQRASSKLSLISKGKHCVETWATIYDQNNLIINLNRETRIGREENGNKEHNACDDQVIISNIEGHCHSSR